MLYSFLNANIEPSNYLNLVLMFGLIVLGGTFGARLVQRFHIPQVVGCVIVGVLLGDCFNVITSETIESLKPFTMFSLGIIGFMIGGELRGEVFKKYGRQFFIILFSQGIGTFLLVACGTSAVLWFITHNIYTSTAMGLLFGAIASATAPASTVNVLWEYKTRGPLTAAVLAIVALDDAMALLLYRGAATGAKALTGTGQDTLFGGTLVLFGEIIGAVILGFLAGVSLYYLLKFVRSDEKILEFALASLMIVVGISMIPGVDPILPAMTLGITIANLAPRQSKSTFELVKKFSPPIFIAFFVLAGAHMDFGRMSAQMVIMTAVYISFRVAGKITGSWLGAKYSGAPAVVQKYLGICLLPQAGVAIGLAILSGQQFNTALGRMIIMVVMTETFIIELLGPMLVKVGVKKAGEVGLNVTEEDLIKEYNVKDIMDTAPASIAQDLSLQEILKIFSTTDAVYYPVIDNQSRITGEISIAGIKEMFANQDVAGWLLACDVAGPVKDKVTPERALEEVMEYMRKYDLEHIAVVVGDDDKLAGVLNYHKVLRKISAEVLTRRKTADEIALATV